MNCKDGGKHQLIEVSIRTTEERVGDKLIVTTTRVCKCAICDKLVEK